MDSGGPTRSPSEEATSDTLDQSTSALGPPPPASKSRRGRKQNDNLPPSRSRDVQRAFRARRAERLAWLEARVSELEAENAELRARLGVLGSPHFQGQSSNHSPTLPRSSSSGLPSAPVAAAPLPLPLPALPRPGSSSSSTAGWLPPAPMYMAHMHPRNSVGESPVDDSQAQDAAALAEFVHGLTAGNTYSSSERSGGPIPPDFVPARVAWSDLKPLSSAARGADPSSPTPAQLGQTIHSLVARQGQPPGAFVRQEGDRVLVSIAAIDHMMQSNRPQAAHQPLPHPPHLPNYPYSHLQSMHPAMQPMSLQQRHSISQANAQDMSPDLFAAMGSFEGE